METKQRKPRTVFTLTAFGKFCSKLRIDLDISVPDWAKALDTTAQTINSYEYGRKEFDKLWDEYKRDLNPQPYPVDLSQELWNHKMRLISQVRTTVSMTRLDDE